MKKLIVILVISLISLSQLIAQNITTIEAKSFDISDNLDLDAVASIFGEARNLEDFENKLNNPRLRLSNLDLNEDGLVDYLRVIETSEYGINLITIQALIARDLFQDVAVISVEKDYRGLTTVQVIGDVYMYGPNYIIQPVYVHQPVIWTWFRGPYYSSWRSPYRWGYYPSNYHHRRACHPRQYQNNVYVHINVHNSYYRADHRVSNNSVRIQKRNRSNDYGRNNPQRSFAKRNNGVKNRSELNRRRDIAQTSSSNRSIRSNVYSQRNRNNVSSSREAQNNNRTTSVREGRDTRQAVSMNRTSRDVQSQYRQTSTQQNRGASSRSSMSSQSVQRQDRQASQTQYSNRQNSQSDRSLSTRAQSTVSNSSRSKAKTTPTIQRQSSQKQIAKSNSSSTSSRRTNGYGRS
ncbi:hypothetical protein [Lentimicrobium sp. S6]|uniref:hypothetical protein n=1 Tax=Lentimicrobium sp. S6 TaxID=2735872 RepID=UPI001555367C|nr:hypothetical protein [Lentimicrobium sp. S6]NPD45797.1 hypothetical protein [Lentimicrobium sp. S6]